MTDWREIAETRLRRINELEGQMAEKCDKHYVEKHLTCLECVIEEGLEAMQRAFEDGRGVERVRQAFTVRRAIDSGN